MRLKDHGQDVSSLEINHHDSMLMVDIDCGGKAVCGGKLFGTSSDNCLRCSISTRGFGA